LEKQHYLAGGWLAASFLISLVATAAGKAWTLRPLRCATDLPWYETARRLYPAVVVAVLGFLPTALLALLFGLSFAVATDKTEHRLIPSAGLAGAFAGALPVSYRLKRRFYDPRITVRRWLRDILVRWLLFLGGAVIAFGVLFASPGRFNARTIVVFLIGAGLIVVLWYGGSLWLLRIFRLATPASPRLTAIAAVSAQETGIPLKGVYELKWQMVNAVAFPMSGAIAFSEAAMEVLNDQEIAAICAHELAHLAEPLGVGIARVLNSMLLLFYVEALILSRSFGLWAIWIALGVFLVGKIILSHRSRAWERRADAAAVSQPAMVAAYGSALLHLYAANMMPLVSSFRGGTHPHAYDRIAATGLHLDFPRPPAPSLTRAVIGLAIVLLTALILNFCAIVAVILLVGPVRRAV
jgi:Zn-dependent protease with chaperone function